MFVVLFDVQKNPTLNKIQHRKKLSKKMTVHKTQQQNLKKKAKRSTSENRNSKVFPEMWVAIIDVSPKAFWWCDGFVVCMCH